MAESQGMRETGADSATAKQRWSAMVYQSHSRVSVKGYLEQLILGRIWRYVMTHSISCEELGMDCPFVAEAENGEDVIDLLMRHVHTAHGDDWYEIEEIYQAARAVYRNTAA